MPDREALQQRLEDFRTAGQNLQLVPLVTQEAFNDFGVEYQTKLIDELEQSVEDCTKQDNKLIFTGHRGCGKSTLLAELGFRLTETNRYFVVMFSISDTIEQSAVDHVNILFSMAVQLLEEAEKRQVKLKPGLKKDLYRWLAKHTKTEVNAVESAIEATGEVSSKVGLPVILEFLLKVKSILKVNSVIRDEISTEFARKISDLIARLNEIQTYIENATGQTVLVMIDDLDKLDLSITETIFSKNIQPLLEPAFRILYTIPIATLREVSLKRNIEAVVKKIHKMPVAKFFSKATVRQVDRVPDTAMMAIFSKILERRLPKHLIDPTLKPQIILKSGGVLRELIRIADSCCDRAMQDIRRQLRQAQFDQPTVVISQTILEVVLTDLQIGYSESLGQNDFDLLKGIYQDFKPKDTENQRFLDLLHGLYLLEYSNALHWYDLNPIVKDLLEQEGVLDGATTG
ncbi:MAG: AAA family ATPase [Lyngbya sp. HA4199-MV5]|jgi:energy-coupling factor transporter ATP-binding protein EcfA2|nr:AAA family ATPase [Lyngbya sp. HA4199-MV5]